MLNIKISNNRYSSLYLLYVTLLEIQQLFNNLKWVSIFYVNIKEILFNFDKKEDEIPLWTLHFLFMLCKMYAPREFYLLLSTESPTKYCKLIGKWHAVSHKRQTASVEWIENCDGKNFALQIYSSHLNVVFYSQVWVFAQALREAWSIN